MGDPAALQEAIQRAKQLAAKMTQRAPVKRPPSGGPSDHSGPIKVTLAYEKPINNNTNSSETNNSSRQDHHHRSSSRDYNRNVRDSRDYKSSDSRDTNYTNHRDNDEPRSNISGNSNYSSQSQNDPGVSHQLSQHQSQQQPPPPQAPLASSRNGDEKIEIIIPHAVIGLVIGKGGENIKRIQNESGATVRVDPNTIDEKGNKLCTITGTKQAVDEAHAQVANVIESAAQNKRPRMQNNPSDSYRMKIPAHRTGAIIGKGGETIKSIKQQSGCEIELDKSAKECGSDESVFILRGSQDKIQKARSLIEQRLARGAKDGPGDSGGGPDRSNRHHGGGYEHQNSNRSSRGVATGANAAPVAQFTDLPTPYAASAGQQSSADMTAAWTAYMAQYSSMYSQSGAQANALAAAGMAYGAAAAQTGMMSASSAPSAGNSAPSMVPQMTPNTSVPSLSGQPAQTPGNDSGQQQAPGGPNASQDFTDQWIEFYIANGRPDYAEQMIQLKKQQQQQQLSQNPQSQ